MTSADNLVSLQPIRTQLNAYNARGMLAAWSDIADAIAARAAVGIDITAAELVERISRIKRF